MSAYHPRPKVPCVRCNKNHDTPAAFLMACAKCERAWHHTCHIPQVSEQEILERLTFDGKGKRDAGLAGWQCKRCTKRTRVEPPPPVVAPDQCVGLSVPAAAFKPQLQSKPSLNGHGHSNCSIGTTSSVPLQPRPSAPIQVTISDDDDIIMLDEAPEQSQQSVADPGNKPQFDTAQTTMFQQQRVPSESLPPRPTPIAASGVPAGKAQKTVKLSKTAQPPSEEPPAGPSTHFNHLPPTSSSSHPPPPESEPEQSRSLTRSPTPTAPHQPIQPEPTMQHISSPAHTSANVKTISTADIRALISTMRSDGRLAPPPEVEYVHTHPRRAVDASNSKPRRSGARKLAYTPERTRSPELDEVAMDVDRPSSRGSNSDTRREEEEEEGEDPHNIDDLYGDIAPRYRSNPSRRSKSRSKTAAAPPSSPPPPAEMRLLRAEGDKRRPPKADDLGLLLDKKLRIEGVAVAGRVRAPRKAAATQRLMGKVLKRKHETGFCFFIHEERKRGTAPGWLTVVSVPDLDEEFVLRRDKHDRYQGFAVGCPNAARTTGVESTHRICRSAKHRKTIPRVYVPDLDEGFGVAGAAC
ncbi:hypothetical protein V8D89_007696 [Ganoderma adspersum]